MGLLMPSFLTTSKACHAHVCRPDRYLIDRMSTTMMVQKAKRMRDEENARQETLRQRAATVARLTAMMRSGMDTMGLVVRAGIKVASVLCERYGQGIP